MNEQKRVLGTCSLSWKGAGRRVSTQKSHCPVGPATGMLCSPGRHTAGIQRGLWIGVGAQHCLPRTPQPSIPRTPSVPFFWFQRWNPTCTESRMWWEPGGWALIWHSVRPVPDSDLSQQGASWDSGLQAPAFSLVSSPS